MAEQKKFVPFVSSETNMAEFTLRALIIGLIKEEFLCRAMKPSPSLANKA